MAGLIVAAPDDQNRLIGNLRAPPYQYESHLGDAVSQWLDKLRIRAELRLYDERGTSANRLLEAG